MSRRIALRVFFVLIALCFYRAGFAASMVLFDFDHLHSDSKKGITAPAIEAYMEGLFGSDISVSRNTTAVNNNGTITNFSQRLSETLGGSDSYLKVGKGKGPSGITIDFGNSPIESFAVDFQLFKKAKSFTILADGVVINQQTLSKAQRKTGLAGHQNAYFFDTPVQMLQFVGVNKKSFAIDNLVINIPLPTDEELDASDSNENGNNSSGNSLPSGGGTGGENSIITNLVIADVPEPSSLLMLVMGLGGAWLSRRLLVL
jgi:hypothetical protein